MAATFSLPLSIDQGATYVRKMVWKAGTPALPVDLTGLAARMQVRERVDSPLLLYELTSANGRVVLGLGADAGTITLNLTASETAAITSWTRGVYDLELVYPDGRVRRLLKGAIRVSPEVTRA